MKSDTPAKPYFMRGCVSELRLIVSLLETTLQLPPFRLTPQGVGEPF